MSWRDELVTAKLQRTAKQAKQGHHDDPKKLAGHTAKKQDTKHTADDPVAPAFR